MIVIWRKLVELDRTTACAAWGAHSENQLLRSDVTTTTEAAVNTEPKPSYPNGGTL